MAGENGTSRGIALRVAAGGALCVLGLVVVIYLARIFVFSWLAELYLLSRGVPSSVDISRLDWNGLDARVRLGARRTPDLAIDDVHAVFNGDWVPQVRSITLSHSVLRVAFDGEKLSFGTLQRMVNSFTAPAQSSPVIPSSPAQTPLRIVLQDAKVLGFTPTGVVSLAGDGAVAGGMIERFTGTIGRANLRAPGFALLLSGGSFSARSDAAGLNVHALASGRGLMFARVRTAELRVSLDLLGVRLQEGSARIASAAAHLHADSIGGRGISAAHADGHFKLGAWQSDSARSTGPLDAVVDLAQAATPSANANAVSLHLISQNLSLDKAASGWRASGPVSVETHIGEGKYRAGSTPLAIASLASQAHGDMSASSDGITGSLTASLQADFSMTPADARKFARTVPLLGDDVHSARAIAQALRGVKLEAANIYIGKSASPLVVTLPAPITLQSRSGARAKLTQSGDVLLSRRSE